MEVLNSENNKANLGRKKRVQMPKPASLEMKKPSDTVKSGATDVKMQSAAAAAVVEQDNDDSYEFEPECLNCGS
jgi:hypothetical protein